MTTFFLSLLLLAAPNPSSDADIKNAQMLADEAAADAKSLRPLAATNTPFTIGIAGAPPFVLEGDTPTGFSVEVGKTIAQRLGKKKVVLKRFSSVKDALDAVVKEEVDMLAGPISITSQRAQNVKFSLPYASANLGIVTRATPQSFWHKIEPFMSKGFLVTFLSFMVALLVVGILIWAVEHRKNAEQFPRNPLKGVGNGMWFALVTMTTVGYGDKAPLTSLGRIIAGVWMIIALIAASSLTASIATALTLSSLDNVAIHNVEELQGKVVAVIPQTPGESIARENRAGLQVHDQWHQAVEAVKEHDVDAFLYDYPVLKHYLEEHKIEGLTVVESSVKSDDYGIVLPLGSALAKRVNIEILKMSETRVMRSLEEKWLAE